MAYAVRMAMRWVSKMTGSHVVEVASSSSVALVESSGNSASGGGDAHTISSESSAAIVERAPTAAEARSREMVLAHGRQRPIEEVVEVETTGEDGGALVEAPGKRAKRGTEDEGDRGKRQRAE